MRDAFIAGYIAGEGCFSVSDKPNGGKQFQFVVTVAADEVDMLEAMKRRFGVGNITDRAPSDIGKKPVKVYRVGSYRELWFHVVPFIDAVGLGPTHKAEQYAEWRAELKAYVASEERRFPVTLG